MKIKFYNNWQDYIPTSVTYKGYFAFILFGFYATNPNYILILCNFSMILETENLDD
jgi:hypothetical protein